MLILHIILGYVINAFACLIIRLELFRPSLARLISLLLKVSITSFSLYVSIYLYIHIYVCVCVCIVILLLVLEFIIIIIIIINAGVESSSASNTPDNIPGAKRHRFPDLRG